MAKKSTILTNKKGQSMKLMYLIIGLIIAALLFTFVSKLGGIFNTETDKDACHTSVLLRGKTIAGVATGQLSTPLTCSTEKKCLTMGGDCPVGYEKISVFNENDIKAELAGSLYDCWWMLGGGEVDFLGLSLSSFQDKQACLFCSRIYFDDQIKSKYPKISGLANYLASTPIPGTSTKYSDYLFGQKNLASMNNLTINTNKDYVISFLMAKSGRAGYLAGAVTGAILLIFPPAGVVVGSVYLIGIGTVGALSGFQAIRAMPAGDVILGLIPFDSESITQFGCQTLERVS